MLAIAFAVISMTCAAMNDFIFKIYSGKKKSIGLYMIVIGIVWTFFFFFRCGAYKTFPALLSRELVTWGVVSGIFSAAANIMLIEGMSRNDVGICSVIYRLNLAPAALMAFIILSEEITLVKLVGITLAIGATLLFFNPAKTRDVNKKYPDIPGLWIVVSAAILRAGMGIIYKFALVPSVDTNAFLVMGGLVWIISGVIYHYAKPQGAFDKRMLFTIIPFGLVSGLFICGIVLFTALALKAGQASTVLPVAQMSFIVTAAAGVIFLGESFGKRQAIGLAMGILCIVFMGLEHTG